MSASPLPPPPPAAAPERPLLPGTDGPGAPASARSGSCDGRSVNALRPGLTVLYDGACPLCRREIALYRGLAADRPVAFVDANDPTAALPDGRDRAELLARFHVLDAEGRWQDGARGFVALWAVMPGWRWLARLAALPGMTPLMEAAYRGFLRVRPLLQRWARAVEKAGPGAAQGPGTPSH